MTINGDMTIESALYAATKQLLDNKSILSPRLDSEVLLCHLLACSRIDLLLKKDSVLEKDVKEAFWALVLRRYKNEPVSYLTNQKEFMSLDFFVEAGVLIPRPETEMLVEFIIDKLKETASPTILDLCTGSGAIAVSLAHYLKHARVTAIDKFDVCTKTAQKNSEMHGLSNRMQVLKADIFEDLPITESFSCIVSNPPYIEREVLTSLPEDVKNYEPEYALDGGNDGLCFYRCITELSKDLLLPKGLLVFEIGYDQGESVPKIIEESNLFSDITVMRDLAGQNRMVTAIKRDL